MKLAVGIVVLVCAVMTSAIAAYFSTVGLAALFAAAFVPVLIMGIGLESCKLVAAAWLHANWKNPRVTAGHKAYLTTGVLVMMMVTSMGIYGFLSKAYLDQRTPEGSIAIVLEQKEGRLEGLEHRRDELRNRQTQINETISTYLSNDRATGATQFMRQQEGERARIEEQIEQTNTEIETLVAEMTPLRQDMSERTAKLGTYQAIASWFGQDNPDTAANILIIMLVIAFDPMAVLLMISATITLSEYMESRQQRPRRRDEDFEGIMAGLNEALVTEGARSESLPEPIDEKTVPTKNIHFNHSFVRKAEKVEENKQSPEAQESPVDESAENADNMTKMIELLETDPTLIDTLVDAITGPVEKKPIHWLDAPNGENPGRE